MTTRIVFTLVTLLIVGIGPAASETQRDDICYQSDRPPCIEVPTALNPDEGKNYWTDINSLPSRPPRCGPRCGICKYNFCVQCDEGELILGKCMLRLDFDDLEGGRFVEVPQGYRGLNYSNFFAEKIDQNEISGFRFGNTSPPRILGVQTPFFGESTSMFAAPENPFSVYSLQLTSGYCTPLIVTFRGVKYNGGSVFYSEVVEFNFAKPKSHINFVNLLVKGFKDLIQFDIVVSLYPEIICPYFDSGDIAVIDDILIY